jgi:uncharacterized protein YceH (UPF0502 family)
MRPLSLLETRVLGVLIEKQHTVPDSYPLSLNSLTLGCNQKSARDPVIEASESEVQMALDELKHLNLVHEGSSSRVTRYAHAAERVLRLPSQSVAILATLFLRGPQTPGELRTNTERLHKFADLSALEGFLEDLSTRADADGGPLVGKLSRAPGARESRWAHLMSGPVADAPATASVSSPGTGSDISLSEMAVLKHEVATLRHEVAALRAALATVKQELGLPE